MSKIPSRITGAFSPRPPRPRTQLTNPPGTRKYYSQSHNAKDSTAVDHDKLCEMFSARYTHDFSRQAILLNKSLAEYISLSKAFTRSSDRLMQQARGTLAAGLCPDLIRPSTPGPGPIHSTIINEISASLTRQFLPAKNFRIMTCTSTAGKHSSLKKKKKKETPDLQVFYSNRRDRLEDVPVLAVDVGFSARPAGGPRRINETAGANAVIQITLRETPVYQRLPISSSSSSSSSSYANPLTCQNESISDVIQRLESVGSADPAQLRREIRLQDPGDPSSPLTLCGVQWVGSFWGEVDVWVRDAETGRAVKRGETIHFDGDGSMAGDIDLRIGEVVPSEKMDQRLLKVDWNRRGCLNLARKMLLLERFADALQEISKMREVECDE